MSRLFIILPAAILFLLPAPAQAFAADLDGWRIVQMSVPDQLAVAKSPAGELRLVRPGDRLGARLGVAGFDGDRLVLEAPGEWGRVRLLVSVADGRQQVASLERQPLRKSEVAGEPAVIEAARQRGSK